MAQLRFKGRGLPLAGHKDNHAGLMTTAQIEALRAEMAIGEGREWEPFEGLALDHGERGFGLDALWFSFIAVDAASPETGEPLGRWAIRLG